MNDTLQNALVAVLQKATQGVTAGVDFLSAQLPDVVRQLLLFQLVRSLIFAVGCIIVFVALGWVSRQIYKQATKPREYEYEDNTGWYVVYIPVGFAVVATGIPFITNLTTALEIWLAPKVWLIEYTASLVK